MKYILFFIVGFLALIFLFPLSAPVVPFQDWTSFNVYFLSEVLDPEVTCTKVFPVSRTVPYTEAIGQATLQELFKGPTEGEQEGGYGTSIPSGVLVQSLSIREGVAYADFNEALQFQIGGSCRVSAIRAQITETLKQFPTVSSVVISIDGRTEDILQP